MSIQDNLMWRAKILEGGKITVPQKVREGLQVVKGDEIVFKLDDNGDLKVGAFKYSDDTPSKRNGSD